MISQSLDVSWCFFLPAAKSLPSCLTLGDPVDGCLLGSSILGILQARTLEWVAIFFSNAWKWKVKCSSSVVSDFTTPWTAAYEAPLSMGVSRKKYWSGLPLFLSSVQFSSVQSLSHVWLFVTPWTAARQASLSITNSQNLLKLMSIKSVMPSNSSSVVPFSSHLRSLPASESFPRSQFFASHSQSIGISASTSVLPMNTQDWSPLGWTGWISLQFKGLSRVFSNTTVQKHHFFSAQFSL